MLYGRIVVGYAYFGSAKNGCTPSGTCSVLYKTKSKSRNSLYKIHQHSIHTSACFVGACEATLYFQVLCSKLSLSLCFFFQTYKYIHLFIWSGYKDYVSHFISHYHTMAIGGEDLRSRYLSEALGLRSMRDNAALNKNSARERSRTLLLLSKRMKSFTYCKNNLGQTEIHNGLQTLSLYRMGTVIAQCGWPP